MSIISEEQAMLLTAGLKLIYDLYGKLDKTLIVQALSRKIPIPPVTRIYSWGETESLIQANPDFLKKGDRQNWWATREQAQSRVRLMIELARELRKTQCTDIYLFAPAVRDNEDFLQLVISVADSLKLVVDNNRLSGSEKTKQIAQVLREAAA